MNSLNNSNTMYIIHCIGTRKLNKNEKLKILSAREQTI